MIGYIKDGKVLISHKKQKIDTILFNHNGHVCNTINVIVRPDLYHKRNIGHYNDKFNNTNKENNYCERKMTHNSLPIKVMRFKELSFKV